MRRELVLVTLFRGSLREQRVWLGRDNNGHRDLLDQEEGVISGVILFPKACEDGSLTWTSTDELSSRE